MPHSITTTKSLPLGRIHRREEEARAKERAVKENLPYLDMTHVYVDLGALTILPEETARDARLAVIEKAGTRTLNTVIEDLNNSKTQALIEWLKNKGYRLKVFLVSHSSLEETLQHYADYTPPQASLKEILRIPETELAHVSERMQDVESLRKTILSLPTSQLLTAILAGAIKTEASDIHAEPLKEEVQLRYRIDGVLTHVVSFHPEAYKQLLVRIKILASLRLNIHDTNQDGRFTIQIIDNKANGLDRSIDARVSILPSSHGETLVIRLLGLQIKKLTLKQLGMRENAEKTLRSQLAKTNGMILTTGPTGSGKTTTLYTLLKELNDGKRNIVTIEDPIEYRIKGVTQSQVSIHEHYTFATGLRAIVRQDPDIIMVGEIRDRDTAEIAVQASLTGHLVLSSLHTNDAAGVVARLQELGIGTQLIPSSLNIAIAQRLVRKLCPHCKEAYTPAPETIEAIKQALSLISPTTHIDIPADISRLWRPVGCKECFGLGYRGRTALFEILTISESIERLILNNAGVYQIRARAMEEGMITLLQEGLLKAVEGLTSLDEVRRVAGDSRYIESLYGKTVTSLLSRSLEIESKVQQTVTSFQQKNLLQELKNKLLEVPVEELLAWIMAGALASRATDVHIEPKINSYLVRYRIDGILEDVVDLPKEGFLPLIAEIKILSGVPQEVHDSIQEGRFNLVSNTQHDIRVSLIPGGYGQTAVLRILASNIKALPLTQLGIFEYHLPVLLRQLAKPNGIILVTGPTSAGKTTTLYAALAHLATSEVKIITIEDPIEYRLENITQTQINEEAGYSFANALRAILRQNPNIILVGEIRDAETAEVAFAASLTGHLILSTLHTNDSVSAITRLINLHVRASDIASSLNLAVAQRLVRRLCENCRIKKTASSKETAWIKQNIKNLPENIAASFNEPFTLYEPHSCEKCGPTGYQGQIGIFEFLEITPAIGKLIAQGASASEILEMARAEGFTTMRENGTALVLEGVTTLAELRRVT